MTRRVAFPVRLHVPHALATLAVIAVVATLAAVIVWLLAAGLALPELAPTRWLTQAARA